MIGNEGAYMAEAEQAQARDVYERLGEHGARLTALEVTQHRDKQDTNNQLREIREVLARIEIRDRGHNGGPQLELLLNRVLDVLSKPPLPPPAPAFPIGSEIVNALKARGAGPVSAVGYFMGGGSLAGMIVWIVLALLGG